LAARSAAGGPVGIADQVAPQRSPVASFFRTAIRSQRAAGFPCRQVADEFRDQRRLFAPQCRQPGEEHQDAPGSPGDALSECPGRGLRLCGARRPARPDVGLEQGAGPGAVPVCELHDHWRAPVRNCRGNNGRNLHRRRWPVVARRRRQGIEAAAIAGVNRNAGFVPGLPGGVSFAAEHGSR